MAAVWESKPRVTRLLRAAASGPRLLVALFLALATTVVQAADCPIPLARLVLVKGSVELVRQGSPRLAVAESDASLCAGDTVVVHQRSQAALLLSNATVVRLDQGTTVTLAPPASGRPVLLNVVSGAIYVISRTPQPFRVRTPFINANVEGTEFLIEARRRPSEPDQASCAREPSEVAQGAESDRVTVFEGSVRVADAEDRESITLSPGESATATATSGPTRGLVIRPRDAVNWTLYVPPIFPAQASLSPLIECASRLVAIGRLEEAKRKLIAASSLDSSGASASASYALLAIIAVAENDREQSARYSELAGKSDPSSAAAWVARSYVQQSEFQIDAALASARKASEISPDALRRARLAELQLAVADLSGALRSASDAAKQDPGLARTHAVVGFVRLARVETLDAKAAFAEAIRLDPSDPMPRLGVGLARIREGDLRGGTEDMELAALLDTDSSLVRSYLGKAYFEEKRSRLAETQLELAKQLDPKDPTPWFYSAILKQSTNRPIEALQDLHASIEHNDNRAVYRSRLLMDDDKAARTTSLAATYAELGFDRLAIAEGVKALAENVGNDAAHRQLASAYANQPRHDIARTSEALQAQIRQPLTLSSIDPEISTDNLGILRGSGPARLAANEFNQLFSRDQIRWQADGTIGSRGTLGDQVIVSALAGKIAFAASQLHYETDGFLDNSRATKNALDVFVQAQVSPEGSLQLEAKHSDFKLGQTFFAFDPLVILPLTIKERSEVVRLNGHYDASPSSDWIFSVGNESRQRKVDNFPDGSAVTETQFNTQSFEAQHLYRSERVQLILGLQSIHQRAHLPIEAVDSTERSDTAYVYAFWRDVGAKLSLQGGAAWEHLRIDNPFFVERTERNRVSPKLGAVWTPVSDTTVRAAAFSAVKRPFIASQTIEPTQIAGFNQFFTGFDALYGDPEGTVSKRVGLGVDQRLARERFGGFELSTRTLDVPSLSAGHDFRWHETSGHVYLYDAATGFWTRGAFPSWAVATSLEYEVEKIKRPQEMPGAEGVVHVTTQRVPIGLKAYRNSATLQVALTYLRQTGVLSGGFGLDSFPTSTSAWITDLSAEYHFPKRMGSASVGVRNLFDKKLDLFQSDPFNPRLALGRLVYAKVRVVF